ncbi:MAG: hypothetical protein ACUVUS_03300 [Thermoproteota archaeon]
MNLRSAMSRFIFPANRLRLASLLRRNGFHVRMHGYEYLVAHDNAFLCLILLQPLENTVLIREFKWAERSRELVEKIVELIRTLDAESRVIMY